ncbi:MAG: tRNA-uridine aminocarboxypropyltransferase [Polyangiaceae bacterium]
MARNTAARGRCAGCRLHLDLCACELIPAIATRTRVVVIIHRSELRKTTNTGRLATQCLVNSELVVRGDHGPSPTIAFPPDVAPVVLFPAPDAVPLAELAPTLGGKPVALVVPDGTWRQAAKVRNRVPGLRDLPCACLPPGEAPSAYRLRASAHDHGLATIEAIARALGVLEGEAIRTALERPFLVMVERTLWARGLCRAEDVTGGVPVGATCHDPRVAAPPARAVRRSPVPVV